MVGIMPESIRKYWSIQYLYLEASIRHVENFGRIYYPGIGGCAAEISIEGKTVFRSVTATRSELMVEFMRKSIRKHWSGRYLCLQLSILYLGCIDNIHLALQRGICKKHIKTYSGILLTKIILKSKE